MQTAIDSGLSDLLNTLQTLIQAVLSDQLIGIYLYGSLLAGDFDPETSDIDLLAIITSDIDDPTFGRLLAMHNQFAANFPAYDNRIEVQYYAADALRHFKTRRSPMIGISPGEPLNRKDAGDDWLLNWYFVREYGRTLLGPDPLTIIPPISHDEFLQASKRDATYWVGWAATTHDQRSQSYAVLTLCRALFVADTGERGSKLRAARHAQTRYPQWTTLINNALQWRKAPDAELSDGQDTWPVTVEFIDFVIDRL